MLRALSEELVEAPLKSMLKCTVCGNPSTRKYQLPEADVYRCFDCDHCFSSLRSSADVERYEPEYFEKTHKNWFAHPDVRLFNLILDQIIRFKPDASILDVGCGQGAFLRHARTRSSKLELTGIDLISNPPDTVNRITFLKGDLFLIEIEQKYDVIVSMAVIEHIADAQGFTRRLKSLCKPGGLVILHTVNDRSVIYGVARLMYALGFKTPLVRLYSKHHLNHYTCESLQRLMALQGFHRVVLICRNMPMAAVDLPPSSILGRLIMKAGVAACFLLGALLRRTFLQTLVCQCPHDNE
jgi:SAM-dependent methyltransferase